MSALDVIKEAREAGVELVLYGGCLSMHGTGKLSPEVLASIKNQFHYIVVLLKKQHKWIDGGQRVPWGLDRPNRPMIDRAKAGLPAMGFVTKPGAAC